MTFHSMPKGPFGEPWGASCKSCGFPIFDGQASEQIDFPDSANSVDMSGTYHAECAQPFASLARAMNMLSRPSF